MPADERDARPLGSCSLSCGLVHRWPTPGLFQLPSS
jgi:hypothetical protein